MTRPDPLVRFRRSSRARRVSLRLDPADGSVIITLPPDASEATALDWMRANTTWIARQRAALPRPSALAHGGTIPFQGALLTIVHRPDAARGIHQDGTTLTLGGDPATIPSRLLTWLKGQATLILPASLGRWSQEMNAHPASLTLRDVRSRWGSCSHEGRIMLSWRLVMAPPPVRDYVIVHELAHLTHFNHSPAFWAHVERFCPVRARSEAWLRTHGRALLAIG